MKIVVAEKHKDLYDFIKQLPKGEYPVDEIIRNHRNTVTKVTVNGKIYIAKQYVRPLFHNRIAYTFLRKSKARRAYEYALELIRRGIGTAEPVAYIEIRKKGLFHTGFFISEFIDEPLLHDVGKEPDKEHILREFAAFTANLHQQGIVHHDYNSCNILFKFENGKYRFSMIDINRMNFRKHLSEKQCFKAMKRMDLETDDLIRYVREYARCRQWEEEYVLEGVFTYRDKFLERQRRKKERKEKNLR